MRVICSSVPSLSGWYAVSIPKKNGSGERILGVPNVGDRIAQMVVKYTSSTADAWIPTASRAEFLGL